MSGNPHLVFELLAYLGAAITWIAARGASDRLTVAARWSMLGAAAAGAAIGRFGLVWLDASGASGGLLRMFGGQTIVGALLGGWIAAEVQKRRLGVGEATGDLIAVPLAVGAAIGRIGCFLAGLPDGNYGVQTTLPWGVDLGDGIVRHPTALYESLFMGLIAIWLTRAPARAAHGRVFRKLMAGYFAFRFAVAFITPGQLPIALGLTSFQWASLAAAIFCVWSLAQTSLRRSAGSL